MSSTIREDIISKCPDDFIDTLNACLDVIEQRIHSISNLVNVNRVEDMADITTAHEELGELSRELY